MINRDITIGQLLSLSYPNYSGSLVLKILTYEEPDEFYDIVNEAIEYASENISSNPQLAKGLNENQITIQIVHQLCSMGLNSEFDASTGGHCDITVRGKLNEVWLGEAKIDKSQSWIWEGFLQLDTRYMPGGIKSCVGGILIYSFKDRADLRMEKWKKYMLSMDSDFVFSSCPLNINAFYSEHVSKRTGATVRIRHMIVPLFFSPEK